jgi:hypothetical protein
VVCWLSHPCATRRSLVPVTVLPSLWFSFCLPTTSPTLMTDAKNLPLRQRQACELLEVTSNILLVQKNLNSNYTLKNSSSFSSGFYGNCGIRVSRPPSVFSWDSVAKTFRGGRCMWPFIHATTWGAGSNIKARTLFFFLHVAYCA